MRFRPDNGFAPFVCAFGENVTSWPIGNNVYAAEIFATNKVAVRSSVEYKQR